MTRLLVLLGDPVEHSLSPRLQNAALRATGLDGVYVPLQTRREDVAGVLRGVARSGGGGNVTLPHKEAAAKLVEAPTEALQRTGACNTFWLEEGRIHGDNTDVEGFRRALHGTVRGFGEEGDGEALVLGAGGGARAVVSALLDEGVERIWLRNRTVARARELVRDLGSSRVRVIGEPDPVTSLPPLRLVVNATRLGIHDGDPLPIDPTALPGTPVLLDLVYRPAETAWVRAGRDAGLRASDGGEMLVEQGALAFERWWGVRAPRDVMRRELDAARGAVEVRG